MMYIIGSGIAGLLAARLLKHHDPVVLEAQPRLPNNHSAVLRFRTSVVGDSVGIPFEEVSVIKEVLPWRNDVADALSYSFKCTGKSVSNRSITKTTGSSKRYIAPPDFIKQLADGVDIRYGVKYKFGDEEKVISTIPMNLLAKQLGYSKFSKPFEFVGGVNVRATVEDCEAYVSMYIPSPDYPFSRVSITGDELIVEIPAGIYGMVSAPKVAKEAAKLLGIDDFSRLKKITKTGQPYSKILPIPERERRDFIYWSSTLKQKAYSLGRFATWRPELLADDLIKDIRIIDRWIRDGSPGYDMEKFEREKEIA